MILCRCNPRGGHPALDAVFCCRTARACEIEFTDVGCPAKNQLHEEGSGFAIAQARWDRAASTTACAPSCRSGPWHSCSRVPDPHRVRQAVAERVWCQRRLRCPATRSPGALLCEKAAWTHQQGKQGRALVVSQSRRSLLRDACHVLDAPSRCTAARRLRDFPLAACTPARAWAVRRATRSTCAPSPGRAGQGEVPLAAAVSAHRARRIRHGDRLAAGAWNFETLPNRRRAADCCSGPVGSSLTTRAGALLSLGINDVADLLSRPGAGGAGAGQVPAGVAQHHCLPTSRTTPPGHRTRRPTSVMSGPR
jgi:hypothetical protein